jgi:hypothetical protein
MNILRSVSLTGGGVAICGATLQLAEQWLGLVIDPDLADRLGLNEPGPRR